MVKFCAQHIYMYNIPKIRNKHIFYVAADFAARFFWFDCSFRGDAWVCEGKNSRAK